MNVPRVAGGVPEPYDLRPGQTPDCVYLEPVGVVVQMNKGTLVALYDVPAKDLMQVDALRPLGLRIEEWQGAHRQLNLCPPGLFEDIHY